ncbi:class I SAM-dependent methyltransferase [Halocatena marina]|uniref:class I SAM-dependent methyltransferase n=1 Tax=Halocatena marina TaxID=2934937 RepID=UPI00200D9F2B|nr:class I SAM-dependent methyltransferase [Halocatena marina]
MTRDWVIDEHQHAGEEHLDPEQVARYDKKLPFDPIPELERLVDYGLTEDETIIDFGTGTGVFPLAAAEYCDQVIAIDISESMLDVAREKADDEGVRNVEFVHDGLVSYEHEGDPASFAFSKNVFHHLPDFWKVEALKTVGDTLEPGGIFRLHDLVYSFDLRDSTEEIKAWLEARKSTAFTEEELYNHFREEFSTYDFLFESMLRETGFKILDSTYQESFYAAYTCEWRGDSH